MAYCQFINKAERELGIDSPEYDSIKKDIRHFFEKALLENKIQLAADGPNMDVERQQIDTVVIHHTSHTPGYRLSYMNAVQLLNVYAAYFCKPSDDEKSLTGKPVWSNHLQEGQPVFYVYHWLLRMDGRAERLLADNHIGWHAGNWDVNTRSVGICLDNDYEFADPEPATLKMLAQFIKKHYPQITAKDIIGHHEAGNHTVCPGRNWLTGWKPQLLNYFN